MTAYWLLFFLPLVPVLMPGPLAADVRRLGWLAMSGIVVIFMGLRHEITADWFNYLDIFDRIPEEFLPAISLTDPSYGAVNWLAARLGWGIYGVNLICSVFFVVGLGSFCRRQPMPWLAWLIATPFLLIVAAMGYTRQGAAMGFVFWGLAYLEDKRVWRFAMLVTLGATFHFAAAVLLPLVFLVRVRTGWGKMLVLVLFVLPVAGVIFLEKFEALWGNYLEEPMESAGGQIRVWMNAVPAVVMLAMSRRWMQRWVDPGHWRWLAWSAIVCVFLVGMASTAVDRVALYLSPLQLYVWSRFPLLFADRVNRTGAALGICLVYAAVLWVWLNFGIHAPYWLPYRNILLQW